MDHDGSKGLAALLALKMVCCGGPLLVMALGSGALALVDVALATGVLALAISAFVLWRRTKRASAAPAASSRYRHSEMASHSARRGDAPSGVA